MPEVRTDIVDVYLLRTCGQHPEFLQLRRTNEPMAGTWQPVMGHIEPGESAVEAAVRELAEEVGLMPGAAEWRGFWQLEEIHPYFIARLDAVMLSPRFLVEVDGSWTPDLSGEQAHDAHRWVGAQAVAQSFLWPGQVRACEEADELLARRGSELERALRLALPKRPE